MAKDTARGLPDFEKMLEKIDPGARKVFYDGLLKGTGRPGQDGLEKQFMEALVNYRGFQEQCDLVIAIPIPVEEHPDVTSLRQRETAVMLHNLKNQEAHLQALGAELARIQAAMAELETAGTKV